MCMFEVSCAFYQLALNSKKADLFMKDFPQICRWFAPFPPLPSPPLPLFPLPPTRES